MAMTHLTQMKDGKRPRRRWRLLAVIGLSIAVAGCGDSEPLSVTKARSATGSHSVTGLLVAAGDDVRLCEVLLESFPPQCGGDSIEVRGLDLTAIAGLQTAGDVSWTDDEVTLTGVLASGVLEVEQ
jgi:hypothetical protein